MTTPPEADAIPDEVRFRKKPVEIEAIQFKGGPESAVEVMAFAGLPETAYTVIEDQNGTTETICISTLEGLMMATVGDWIIHGIRGEFYPCKPDIFAATYEPADRTRNAGWRRCGRTKGGLLILERTWGRRRP